MTQIQPDIKPQGLVHKLDHLFLRYDPPVWLKLFFPYHIVWATGKMLWAMYHLAAHDAHNLMYDSRTQWKFHLKMSWFWLANFPFITIMFFFFPKQWIGIGLLVNTYYSLYANFDTEFGAIPASYAAMKAEEIQAAQRSSL